MRLFEIARAIETVGGMAMPVGTELQSLHLVVPVSREPSRELRAFWRTEIKQMPGRLARWMGFLQLGRRRSDASHHVRISWVEGRMTGAILRGPFGREPTHR
uniref:hypothetical protein n=1 Tax=Parerythrobacter lutipelagi TaxID=1964208 RepID=UPI0010F97179|nr:hypothetical protein [Parerythrobacter lutipelagi]